MKQITAIIPTFNEEDNIAKAISSVDFVDEILVVDSFSKDKTTEIAASMGAKIIQREYEYSASQKNWAIPQAKYEWILLLDADEIISDQLKKRNSKPSKIKIKNLDFDFPRKLFLRKENKIQWLARR